MERLFSYPEWKILEDDIKGWLEAIAAQWRTLRPDQLAFEQGRYDGLEQVLKHGEICEKLKAQALADAADSLTDPHEV